MELALHDTHILSFTVLNDLWSLQTKTLQPIAKYFKMTQELFQDISQVIIIYLRTKKNIWMVKI